MPVYITLPHYIQQGIENIKEGPARLERAREVTSAAGGQLHAFYLTLGHYDAVSIGEAPSDKAYAVTILALAAGGAIRTESLRAFTEDEYREIITSLP
jgi:uncharacterized protein with GYD domain